MKCVKVFINAYGGGDKNEIGVYSSVSARLFKVFKWDVTGYKEAKDWCEENGYVVEMDYCKSIFDYGDAERGSVMIPLSRIIEAYKEYAREQIRGGEADIGMLDVFLNDYLHIDTGVAYDEVVAEENSKDDE